MSVVLGGFLPPCTPDGEEELFYQQWSHQEAVDRPLSGNRQGQVKLDPDGLMKIKASLTDQRLALGDTPRCTSSTMPWMGGMGPPFERTFRPDFLAGLRKKWDDYCLSTVT